MGWRDSVCLHEKWIIARIIYCEITSMWRYIMFLSSILYAPFLPILFVAAAILLRCHEIWRASPRLHWMHVGAGAVGWKLLSSNDKSYIYSSHPIHFGWLIALLCALWHYITFLKPDVTQIEKKRILNFRFKVNDEWLFLCKQKNTSHTLNAGIQSYNLLNIEINVNLRNI